MTLDFIDTTFDFRTDSAGKDVDIASPTLKRFHQLLWSKPLPNGEKMDLSDAVKNSYLVYESKGKIFYLSSDSISNSYRNTKKLSHLLLGLEDEVQRFQQVGNSIGGYIIFPSKSEEKGMSINQSRGFNQIISDRFDFTLECIRLHYLGGSNPLEEVLNRNSDYFKLFGSFIGYVKFFLLDDLVNSSFDSISFFIGTQNFKDWGLPKNRDEYLQYLESSVAFTKKRNKRIQNWANINLDKSGRTGEGSVEGKFTYTGKEFIKMINRSATTDDPLI
jgi:hypothetical protein